MRRWVSAQQFWAIPQLAEGPWKLQGPTRGLHVDSCGGGTEKACHQCFFLSSFAIPTQVLSYALQHNAYTIQSFAERAVALSAATSDKQKVKLAGADAHLVPQRSEFDSLSKGCDAWRLGEIAELHSAVQVGTNVKGCI